jgi:hypothetical protein
MSVIRAIHTGWVIGVSNGKHKELALAILYERRIRGLRIINSLNRATLQLEARLL